MNDVVVTCRVCGEVTIPADTIWVLDPVQIETEYGPVAGLKLPPISYTHCGQSQLRVVAPMRALDLLALGANCTEDVLGALR